jgi:hypothetical protein
MNCSLVFVIEAFVNFLHGILFILFSLFNCIFHFLKTALSNYEHVSLSPLCRQTQLLFISCDAFEEFVKIYFSFLAK